MSESRQTAFHPITSKIAAGFMEEAGWFWVTNFGDTDAEYRALFAEAGFRLTDIVPIGDRFHYSVFEGVPA